MNGAVPPLAYISVWRTQGQGCILVYITKQWGSWNENDMLNKERPI